MQTGRAFSLVELSIVLVILGLLVGGILAGQSLIQAASMRRVLTWQTEMQTKIFAFRDRYHQLPGDMSNATSFWNRSTTMGCGSDPGTASATGTCNGNGNGYITWTGPAENHFINHHLALAGLDQTPIFANEASGTSPYWATPGLPNGARSFIGSNSPPYAELYAAPAPNGMLATGVGLQTSMLVGASMMAPALPPEKVWNMDTKIDDGLPASGQLQAANGTTDGSTWDACMSAAAPFTYTLTTTINACRFMYLLSK